MRPSILVNICFCESLLKAFCRHLFSWIAKFWWFSKRLFPLEVIWTNTFQKEHMASQLFDFDYVIGSKLAKRVVSAEKAHERWLRMNILYRWILSDIEFSKESLGLKVQKISVSLPVWRHQQGIWANWGSFTRLFS